MKKLAILFLSVMVLEGYGQGEWNKKFEQLGTMLPTPNSYRSASGRPGPEYWQQKADYEIDLTIDDERQFLEGSEKITYYNNSPEVIEYLWVQLDQNRRAEDSNEPLVSENKINEKMNGSQVAKLVKVTDNPYGFNIVNIWDSGGNNLNYTINKTMMRVELPEVLKPGEDFTFNIEWNYYVNNRAIVRGRSGYEYFPEDGNYIYAIAQFYPRMAVYDDVNGWQNKQFLGTGEFATVFGDYKVSITVPEDHIVASTGVLQNASEVLSPGQMRRFEAARNSEEIIMIVTEEEARKNEQTKSRDTKTWTYYAENVRDFAFASSRKFIWDACMVPIGDKKPLAMSFYPKEGNPLWEQESTRAVKNTLITYSKYTFDYPYPVAISVHTASIGMEYPMICFNFGRPDADGTFTDRKKYGTIGVIIHEVGHNYFPMIINSDERQWTWMDEGLNTFLQTLTQREMYEDYPLSRGKAEFIVPYMKGNKENIRPIMTNSEQILQFGNNAYSKPAAALNILRETVMGPELFDYAFKKYAQRWKFRHPTPADFFRTMEDASAVDLDWFWRGWFFSTDHVDISVDEVKWFVMRTDEKDLKGKKIEDSGGSNNDTNELEETKNDDFSKGPREFTFHEADGIRNGEFLISLDDEQVLEAAGDKNFYEVTLKNEGGLVMPVILQFNYTDGTSEIKRIPAEIWRKNEHEVKKVFTSSKELEKLVLDPFKETADVETTNNYFPRQEVKSRFDKFKDDGKSK